MFFVLAAMVLTSAGEAVDVEVGAFYRVTRPDRTEVVGWCTAAEAGYIRLSFNNLLINVPTRDIRHLASTDPIDPPEREPELTPAPTPKLPPSLAPGRVSSDGFQKTRWGMTKAQVKKVVALPARADTSERLIFRDIVAEHYAEITYDFERDRLVGVVVDLFVLKSDPSDDFNELEQLLTKKYGAPRELSEKPSRSFSIRTTELTEIVHLVEASRLSNHLLRYRSRELIDAVSAEKEKAKLSDL